MYPPNPNWLSKLFEGGKGAVTAGIVFGYWLGQTMAKSQRNPWHEIARQAGEHFREAGYIVHEREHYGKHTDREHERRQHRHGEGHDR